MVYKKKIIAGLFMGIAFLGVVSVQTTQASDFGASVWARYFKDVIVKAAAQAAYKVLSNRIIEQIQHHGAGGGAAFVQDWIQFTADSQKRGEGIFRAELSQSHLCDYFKNNIKSAFTVSPTANIAIPYLNLKPDSLNTFGVQTNCTLPGNFKMANYQQDFAGNGGWDAWSRMLQPQNNPYGVLFASLNEVSKQRNLSQITSTNNAVAGGGFTGIQEGCDKLGLGSICLKFGNIKTPGELLGKAAGDATSGGTTALLAAADGASVAVSALTTWVINKLFDLAGGSTNDSTDASITSEERTNESYAQEFCTAQDNISREAAFYIKAKFPQAFGPVNHDGKNYGDLGGIDPVSHKRWINIVGSASFPLEHNKCDGGNDICGESFCTWSTEQYHTENTYPFSRCSQACLKAVSQAPNLPAPYFSPPPIAPPEKNWPCTSVRDAEVAYMLPKLNAIPPMNPVTSPASSEYQAAVQAVIDEASAALDPQIIAVGEPEGAGLYYPANNTIGLPELYFAGPLPGRPTSPGTGQQWDFVFRTCGTPEPTVAPPSQPGLTCNDVPTANACTAPNQKDLVQRVIDFVKAQGIYTFVPNTTDYCGKFEITKRVACAAGGGLLQSYHSSSCNDPSSPANGLDGRYIAFPDNSELKVLNDAGATWDPAPPGTEYPAVKYVPVPGGCPVDPPGSY